MNLDNIKIVGYTLHGAYTTDVDGDITIPDEVKVIAYHAFFNCKGIKSVCLGKNVKMIQQGAFEGCENLKKVVLSERLESIDDYAFYKCKNLASIFIPDSVTLIGDHAFFKCNKLETVSIPRGVRLGEKAFDFKRCCKGLKIEYRDPQKDTMKNDKNQRQEDQAEMLLFPMEKNKTKASEKQPETHYFTWESFAATIPILEKQVRHKTFTCVYGNSRGGLLLAVLLSHQLGLPLVTTPYASMLWCEDIVDDSETYLRSKRLFPGAVYCAIVTRKYAKDIIHAFDYTKKTALVKFPWEDV